MDKESVHQRILMHSGDIVSAHTSVVDRLFDVSTEFGDAMTNYYNDGLDNILVPGYKKGNEILSQLSILAEGLKNGTKYIAVVRVITVPHIRHGGLIGKTSNQNVRQAFVRIYTDLTPDKITFEEGSETTEVGGDPGQKKVKSLIINHPSAVFAPGNTEVEESLDEEAAYLATTRGLSGSNAHLWGAILQEEHIEPKFIVADNLDLLEMQLNDLGHSSDFPFGVLAGITLDSPAFRDWVRGEREGHDVVALRRRLAKEATKENTP